MIRRLLIFILFSLAVAAAQMPAPEAPRVYVDTTWNPPTGVTWAAHTSADFRNALTAAQPGDTIVLDAGVTYSGYFTVPAKANPNGKWIYIMSSALVGSSQVMPSGVEVSPASAQYMAKIVTTNGLSPLTIAAGANHIRLAGLEITTQASSSNALVTMAYSGTTIPDSITVDRCYIHGDDSHDSHRGVEMNASNAAVIDSYISDIHYGTNEAQAIGLWWTPGPLKIVDNFLSATTQEILFGGAGGLQNLYVPSDIEIRNNHFYKPLSWRAIGVTIPPNNPWIVKNNLELKSGRRALIDHNLFENNWASAQTGSFALFKPTPSQSGPNTVVDDVTFSNNHAKGVVQGIQGSPGDPNCCPTCTCTTPGESKRVKIYNNLIEMGDNTGPGGFNGPISLLVQGGVGNTATPGLTDWVWQHNTIIPPPGQTYCAESFFFNSFPLNSPRSQNVWILDNVLCRQPTGNGGFQGTSGLTTYMGLPAPLDPRFYGNVMYAPVGDRVYPMPAHNYVSTVPFTYVDPANGNYQLASPNWTDTSDGAIAGYTPGS